MGDDQKRYCLIDDLHAPEKREPSAPPDAAHRRPDGVMIYRRFETGDKPRVLRLLRKSFNGWRGDLSERYFDWKFERNPHGPARIWVCVDQTDIVGCYVWNPVWLRKGGARMLGAQSVDAAVDPDYQGRGIYSGLVGLAVEEAALDGIELVYALPTQGAYGGQLRGGFLQAFSVPKFYRPLPGLSFRRSRLEKCVFGTRHTFGDAFDVFDAEGAAPEIVTARDASYLEWRFNQNPVTSYDTVTCEQDGILCGYAVTMVDSTRRVTRGHVVDFRVLPAFASTAAPLLRTVLRHLMSRGVRVAVSWSRPCGLEQETMQSVGFSVRYVVIRRKIEHPSYVDQFIVFDAGAGSSLSGDSLLRWSLVPGDADYI